MSQFIKVKKHEAKRRMFVIRKARTSRRSAKALQRRVSLVGSKRWRITNLDQVVVAMARWT